MKTKTLMAAAVAAMAFGAFAKDIYLLVGQSNMAGRASLRGGDAPCDGPHPELGVGGGRRPHLQRRHDPFQHALGADARPALCGGVPPAREMNSPAVAECEGRAVAEDNERTTDRGELGSRSICLRRGSSIIG